MDLSFLSWTGGGIVALFVGWFLWNWQIARRPGRDPLAVAQKAVQSALKSPQTIRTTEGNHAFVLTHGCVRIVLTTRKQEDVLTITSPAFSLFFSFYEGQMVLLEIDNERLPSLHPLVRSGGLTARRMLNSIRMACHLASYGGGSVQEFEDRLAERKKQSTEHKTDVEARLKRGKRKDE